MEQKTTDTRSGTPFAPCLEDFRQTVVDIPVVVIVLLSSSGRAATLSNFAKKHAIVCLEALLFLLNFTGGFSFGKTHNVDCCFVSGSVLVYPGFCLLLRCPRHEIFLRRIFLACGCTSPPYPTSALHSGYGAPNGQQRFLTPKAVLKNASETSR